MFVNKKWLRSGIKILLIFVALFSAIQVNSLNLFPAENLAPEKQHPIVSQIISKLLARYHFSHQRIDDRVSSEVLDLYLENLDRSKMYFLAADIEQFEDYRYVLDDNIKAGNLETAYLIFNVFKERVEQRIEYALERLEQKFDFSVDEYFPTDREEAEWAKSRDELNDLWRRKIKNEALNLKLAGKDGKGIKETLRKRYLNYRKRFEQYKSEDVFRYYINALSETFDPHTSYLSPRAAEQFEIDMSLSFEGIGAQLVTEDDYTKVVRILPGGPADRSKQLWANDKIIGVGQDEDGEIEDVIGMRLDDVVQKIRGKKGSKVRLEIIPAENTGDGPTKIITLVRDKIILEEQAARSETVEMTHNNKKYKLGIIDIPSFYADLNAQRQGKKNYRSTTRDVRKLLDELKKENIDGLIIDLRRNGGGSLQEAIDMSGLFIKEGPVVQVKNSAGTIRVEKDVDPEMVYDGPLVVMVDRFSASASEIFAAAMQDYGRGLIVGSRTFGKGTVQNMLSLDRFVSADHHRFGQMKVTIAKFYRINGGTTQHRGVIPDITFPSLYEHMEVGESNQYHALPWDEITQAMFQPEDHVSKYLSTLKINSLKRTANDREFQYLKEDIESYRKKNDLKTISLLEAKRIAERGEKEARRLARINARRIAKGLKPLKKGEKIPNDEESPDALLTESQRILADLIALTRATERAEVK
ncbi:MAG: carboxy terminal-processing peptidase [bacterium]